MYFIFYISIFVNHINVYIFNSNFALNVFRHRFKNADHNLSVALCFYSFVAHKKQNKLQSTDVTALQQALKQ